MGEEDREPKGNRKLAVSLIPEGYRLLAPGEPIEDDDLYFDGEQKKFLTVKTAIHVSGTAAPFIAIVRPVGNISDQNIRDLAQSLVIKILETGAMVELEKHAHVNRKSNGAYVEARIWVPEELWK